MIHLHLSTTTAVKAAIGCGLIGAMYMQPFRTMVVSGHSMEPTYMDGTISLTRPVSFGGLKVGDVVVINRPDGTIVKRIAFLPGDKILQAKISDKWTDLVGVDAGKTRKLQPEIFRDYTIPEGYAYVLGDNKEVSDDSRNFGAVPMSQIESKLLDQRPSARL